MLEITFHYSRNVFLDNGILGVYAFLQRLAAKTLLSRTTDRRQRLETYQLEAGTHFKLTANQLWIKHEQLFDLLEDLYYTMGEEVYDTYTDKQFQEAGNLYFSEQGELLGRFPKMNTYGLTDLLTNNAQGTTPLEANTLKFADIEKNNPDLAHKIETSFEETGVKLLKKVYFNEWYTKITRLEPPRKEHFAAGLKACYLTGESYKRLVDAQNISPFFSGLLNFNSNLSAGDKKISWKALYLSRFAPAQCLYLYSNKLRESLLVYFIQAEDLERMAQLHSEKFFTGIMRNRQQLLSAEYLANFPREEVLGKSFDYIGRSENLFLILYSFYKHVLGEGLATGENSGYDFIMREFGERKPAVSLVSIRADAFASTMRPSEFETLTNFKYAMWLISQLEAQKLNVQWVMQSLKLIKPSLAKNQNRYAIERQIREAVLQKVLSAKSILNDMESFFNDCYGYLLDTLKDPTKNIGFKRYDQLLLFAVTYESLINPFIMENPQLKDRAIKLGAQVGQGILSYGEIDRKTNARQGRKYIIRLRKAMQFDRFLAGLSSIQERFGLSFSRELLDGLDEENYVWIKQFIIISALNQINAELSLKSATTKTETAA